MHGTDGHVGHGLGHGGTGVHPIGSIHPAGRHGPHNGNGAGHGGVEQDGHGGVNVGQ